MMVVMSPLLAVKRNRSPAVKSIVTVLPVARRAALRHCVACTRPAASVRRTVYRPASIAFSLSELRPAFAVTTLRAATLPSRSITSMVAAPALATSNVSRASAIDTAGLITGRGSRPLFSFMERARRFAASLPLTASRRMSLPPSSIKSPVVTFTTVTASTVGVAPSAPWPAKSMSINSRLSTEASTSPLRITSRMRFTSPTSTAPSLLASRPASLLSARMPASTVFTSPTSTMPSWFTSHLTASGDSNGDAAAMPVQHATAATRISRSSRLSIMLLIR